MQRWGAPCTLHLGLVWNGGQTNKEKPNWRITGEPGDLYPSEEVTMVPLFHSTWDLCLHLGTDT